MHYEYDVAQILVFIDILLIVIYSQVISQLSFTCTDKAYIHQLLVNMIQYQMIRMKG